MEPGEDHTEKGLKLEMGVEPDWKQKGDNELVIQHAASNIKEEVDLSQDDLNVNIKQEVNEPIEQLFVGEDVNQLGVHIKEEVHHGELTINNELPNNLDSADVCSELIMKEEPGRGLLNKGGETQGFEDDPYIKERIKYLDHIPYEMGEEDQIAQLPSHTADPMIGPDFPVPVIVLQDYKYAESMETGKIKLNEIQCVETASDEITSLKYSSGIRRIDGQEEEKKHQCDVCNYSTFKANNLSRHRRTIHTSEKPYQCGTCEYSSADAGHMARHRRKHTGEKPYKCGTCEYSSAYASSIVTHRRTHTGVKPYKCGIGVCDYSSACASQIVAHRRKHAGAKPYRCGICDYSSANRSTMVEHRRIHRPKPISVKYQCDTCDYSSTHHYSVVKHRRIHTGEKPFECGIGLCDYASSSHSHILTHRRKHTGEKPYKCGTCDYSTADSSDMVKHRRTHTGERPYKCGICHYSSAQSSHAHRHKHAGAKAFR